MDEKVTLEQFLLDNQDLEHLESLLAEFNVFEITDIVRAEVRHSNVLSWLLSPKANHGLGDQFLRLFLKHLFSNNRESIKSQVTFFDIEVFDLDDIEIRREWRRIDVLMVSPLNKLVVAIENKVDSGEHDSQLERYHGIITREFPDYHRLFTYLTPEGNIPSDEGNWIIFDYSSINSIISKLLETRKTVMSESVYDFLNQYCTILRRYVMPNSEIAEICQRIYHKHKTALDLIFQYKPDIETEVSAIVQGIILKHNNLILDTAGKTVIRFISKPLDIVPKEGEGWTASKRILLFEFGNWDYKLVLRLYIGPGNDEIRNRLYEIAQMDTKLFNKSERKLRAKWLAICQKEYLKPKEYEELSAEELTEQISQRFKSFLNGDLKLIESHISNNWGVS